MEYKELINNKIKTTLIKTKKFKTIVIQVVFLGEFNKEIATKRSLLSRVLPITTKNYPTKKAIFNKLYDLYDARVSVTTNSSYKTSITKFTLEYINPTIVSDNSLHSEAIELLYELIFNPSVKDNAFDSRFFNEQKSILKQNIMNIYNNKSRYALRQLLNHMGKDEIISVSGLGNLEDLESITEKDIYDVYLDMINNENVEIYVIGDFEEEEMLASLSKLNKLPVNNNKLEVYSQEAKEIIEVKEIVEKQNINQTRLMMGFRTTIDSKSELQPALMLFNRMFGGSFQSDLIRVVREENSLAYSISSQNFVDLKILFVSAGIDSSKYDLTKNLVIDVLNNYKEGKIDLDSLNLAKDNIINDIKEIEDSPYSGINFYFYNNLLEISYDLEENIKLIKDVTIDQIQEVAKGITLDTIFLLASEDYNG